jgi:hypothetical protein
MNKKVSTNTRYDKSKEIKDQMCHPSPLQYTPSQIVMNEKCQWIRSTKKGRGGEGHVLAVDSAKNTWRKYKKVVHDECRR